MKENQIQTKLNRLSSVLAEKQALQQVHEAELKEALVPVQEAVDVLATQLKQALVPLELEESKLRSVIADATKSHGTTVHGDCLMAVWSKGRVSWNTPGLDGFAVAHPEVNTFRTEGEPSVSIRSK